MRNLLIFDPSVAMHFLKVLNYIVGLNEKEPKLLGKKRFLDIFFPISDIW